MAALHPAFFSPRVLIGVGDLAVSNQAQITLSTYALGSCVGVVAYDPAVPVGGMLHLMLPDSAISPKKAADQPAMFADTGLPLLFRGLVGLKADYSRLRIFVAGGANVLCGQNAFKIGERNVRATFEFLTRHGFATHHAMVGGSTNRALHLVIGTGELTLKMPDTSSVLSLGD